MSGEKRRSILDGIDTRTKVLALICLTAEVLFLASLAALPAEHILYALIACAVILLVMVVGIVVLERGYAGPIAVGSQRESGSLMELAQAIAGVWLFDVSREDGPDGTPYKKQVSVLLKASGEGVEGSYIDAWRDNYHEEYLVLCHVCFDGWYPRGNRSWKIDLPRRVSWRSVIA